LIWSLIVRGPTFDVGKSIWLPGWLNDINDNNNSLFLTIDPGDFLVHHAIALGLHTTTLILVKGALDASGSKLLLDKKDFGYSFPCDGLGRGGTCDILAWDTFYLAVFWMLNTIGWVTFYCHNGVTSPPTLIPLPGKRYCVEQHHSHT
jgi:photosystem I P700 chlorophyll a apoprotein A2